MKGFQEIFGESAELRESLSEYYALVIELCTESIRFLKKNCTCIDSLVIGYCLLRLTVFPQAIHQFTGLLGPFGFQKFEKQLGEQQQTIILQQSLAAENAAHNSRLQMSLFQQRGERHWDEEMIQWAGNNERELSRAANEKST